MDFLRTFSGHEKCEKCENSHKKAKKICIIQKKAVTLHPILRL